VSWIAAIFELLGMHFVGNKKKFAFLFLILCNIFWAIVAVKNSIPGLLLTVFICIIINIRNFIKWNRKKF